MTHIITLELTEAELQAVSVALQVRSNSLLENIKINERLDIKHILERMFESNTNALAQVEKTIEASYSYN
jgi:hypothetical protein